MSQTPDEVTTLAYQWIVQRPDGVGFAATSHDERQHVGATTFDPGMELKPGRVLLSSEMFGSELQLEGAVGRGLEPELLSGRWNGASVSLLASDWMQEEEGFRLCSGELDRAHHDNGRLAASVDLLPAALKRSPCIQTSPECRAMLGDRLCRVDMRARRLRVCVSATDDDGIIVNERDTKRFRMGRLRWLSGANCGVEQLIIACNEDRLVLQDSSRWSVTVGDRAILSEGCDGRRTTCTERFGNILNFRGEPDLPGSEILLRFPGA